MILETVYGDLLAQPVEAIVNAWNRNLLPWWLLRPHGVAGAIRLRAGSQPFRELRRHGMLAPGQAVITGAGRLPYRGIIHVSSITPWGRSSAELVASCVDSALLAARQAGYASLALPVLGSGSGGLDEPRAYATMRERLLAQELPLRVVLVCYASTEK